MNGPKIIIFKYIAISALFLCIFSCENKKVITGKYVYITPEQKCELLINIDGSFSEKIYFGSTGQEFDTTGTWSQKNSGLLFNGFLYSVGNDKGSVLNPPQKYSSAPATANGDIIIFEENSEYWFRLSK